nr:hypothetical protein BCU33_10990 [Vibrio lentus]
MLFLTLGALVKDIVKVMVIVMLRKYGLKADIFKSSTILEIAVLHGFVAVLQVLALKVLN